MRKRKAPKVGDILRLRVLGSRQKMKVRVTEAKDMNPETLYFVERW
jgi:hypothetical protein